MFSLDSNQGKKYQLDRSLFERLAVQPPGKPRFPSREDLVKLTGQHVDWMR